MDHDFWISRWEQGRIGFHAGRPHPRLVAHWPSLGLAPDARVLVPLCGKSLDLAWLADRGHDVVGVELSPIACRAFFEERGVTPSVTTEGPFVAWRAGRVTILQGDVLELRDTRFDAAYDRAATVALPDELRRPYVATLGAVLAAGAPLLLITFEYPQEERQGPPFSIPEAEVRRLYEADFAPHRLARDALTPSDWNVSSVAESTWRLDRR